MRSSLCLLPSHTPRLTTIRCPTGQCNFHCSITLHTLTSIPDSFNLDQLSAALENAPAEQEHHINEKASHLMNDEIWDLAHDEVMRTGKMTNNGPVFHKAIVMQILAKLQYFHTAMGDSIRENEAPEDVVNAWHRDAGKIQAAICILMTISVDDDDFMLEESCK